MTDAISRNPSENIEIYHGSTEAPVQHSWMMGNPTENDDNDPNEIDDETINYKL